MNGDITKACGVIIASVDFRRAIDDRLDLTVEDAIAATDWVFGHRTELGAERIIIAGESSGAHLTSYAFLELRRRRGLEGFSGFLSLCGGFDRSGSDMLRRSDGRSLIIDAPSRCIRS